jgi:hypothetical protein
MPYSGGVTGKSQKYGGAMETVKWAMRISFLK